jgi:hypothetical protein
VTVSGGGGNDTLTAGADISGISVSGVDTLQIGNGGSVELTADQLANFGNIQGPQTFDPMTFTIGYGTGTLYGTTAVLIPWRVKLWPEISFSTRAR